jgi:hypothetical protein
MSSEQLQKVTVPGDGDCLLHSVTVALLAPVIHDDSEYTRWFQKLYPRSSLSEATRLRCTLRDYLQSGCLRENLRESESKLSLEHPSNTFLVFMMNSLRTRLVELMKVLCDDPQYSASARFDAGADATGSFDPLMKAGAYLPQFAVVAMSSLLGVVIHLSTRRVNGT